MTRRGFRLTNALQALAIGPPVTTGRTLRLWPTDRPTPRPAAQATATGDSTMNLNHVTIAGRLVRDSERRGNGPATFSIAINRKFRTKSGDDREETVFVPCEYWGGSADELCKGDTIFADGRLRLDEWEDRETGTKRSRIVVVIEQLHALPNDRRPTKPKAAPAPVTTTATKNDDLDESEIPF